MEDKRNDGIHMPPDENPFAGQRREVHTAITCDGCGARPLCGVRHLCVMCKTVNLCTGCFEAGATVGSHSLDHVMLRVVKSGRDARSVFSVQLVDDDEPVAVVRHVV